MANKKIKKGNVPNLRFPGFIEEWKVKKLKDLGDFIGGGTPDTTNQIFWTGTIPWISSSDIIIDDIHIILKTRFITDEAIKLSATKLIPKGGILMVSRVGIGKFAVADEELCTSQDFTNLVTTENEYFLCYYFSARSNNFIKLSQGTSIKGFTTHDIKSTIFYIPLIQEQQKIASFLSLIDTRIQTQNKIIQDFKLLKKLLIKKIFSQQIEFKDKRGNTFPEWQNKTLSSISKLVKKRNKYNEKLPVYSINNKQGFVPQNEQFEGVDSDNRGYDIKLYKLIERNTFAYNPARINVGSIGYSGDLENIIISSLYVCFKTLESVNDDFLFQYLKTDFFNKEVLKNVEGGVREYLFFENFGRIKINLPCLEEQNKIAYFFSAIDSKIDIENGLLQKLEAQKKYLLQNIFV